MSGSTSTPETSATAINGLAAYIGVRRHELGLSLRQLEAVSGISFSWLSKLETRHSADLPTGATLVALARSLETTVSELLVAANVDVTTVLPPPKIYNALRRDAAAGAGATP